MVYFVHVGCRWKGKKLDESNQPTFFFHPFSFAVWQNNWKKIHDEVVFPTNWPTKKKEEEEEEEEEKDWCLFNLMLRLKMRTPFNPLYHICDSIGPTRNPFASRATFFSNWSSNFEMTCLPSSDDHFTSPFLGFSFFLNIRANLWQMLLYCNLWYFHLKKEIGSSFENVIVDFDNWFQYRWIRAYYIIIELDVILTKFYIYISFIMHVYFWYNIS